jgi:hypothetical protein
METRGSDDCGAVDGKDARPEARNYSRVNPFAQNCSLLGVAALHPQYPGLCLMQSQD